MPATKATSKTPARPRARKATEPAEAAPSLDPDEKVTKHVRYRRGTWDTADARATGDGRELIDVLRAFLAKYAAGTIDV